MVHREIRGLSKKLIDEHETWTSHFRDPWNESLPVVNPICPLLTNREGEHGDESHANVGALHHVLLHHQQCWRRPPLGNEDLCFHITFYEIVHLEHQDEFTGEFWRSGKLHSENKNDVEALFGSNNLRIKESRIKESACTVSWSSSESCTTYLFKPRYLQLSMHNVLSIGPYCTFVRIISSYIAKVSTLSDMIQSLVRSNHKMPPWLWK
jgi:hypothetical protein